MKLTPWRERSLIPAFRSDLEEWFDEVFAPTRRLPEAFRRPLPPVNLAENEKEFTASVELPGMEEKDIEIQLLGNQLVISGERRFEDEKKEKGFYRVESQYGAFRRAVELPEGLVRDGDAITATFGKGILEVKIPKVEPKPTAKIKIKSK